MEAFPEVAVNHRLVSCAIVSGRIHLERHYAEALVDCLGGRTLPTDLGGLGWLEVLKEPVLLLPWQNEGCIACGTKAQLSRCSQCLRPMHLTCAVHRKKIGEQPLCLNCQAATSAFSLNSPSAT